MESISPVWTEAQIDVEQVVALDQPQYKPIIVLPVLFEDGTRAAIVRFELTDEEQKAVAEGADLCYLQLTCGGFAPMQVNFCKRNEQPF